MEALLWNHCCGIIACGIIAVESLLWNHCCGITEWEASVRHLEAPRGHPGHLWDPRRHPGGTQGTKEARGALEEKCAKSCVFFRQDARDPAFYRRGREVTLTISAACAQKLAGILRRNPVTTTTLVDHRNPYSRELFGEQSISMDIHGYP